MKAQRLKITEPGMATFSDHYCGIKFTNGLSDEAVAPSVARQIGAYIRIEGVDDDAQVGEGKSQLNSMTMKAEVKVALTKETPQTESKPAIEQTLAAARYTKESLASIADAEGIAGLRKIADDYGVKGRGIVELINEILKAQG